MQSTVYTNCNDAYSILQRYVNVKLNVNFTQRNPTTNNIIILDTSIQSDFSSRDQRHQIWVEEFKTSYPALHLLPLHMHLAKDGYRGYQSTYWYNGSKWFSVFHTGDAIHFEEETACYPTELQPNDFIFVINMRGIQLVSTLRGLLSSPRMVQNIAEEVYFKSGDAEIRLDFGKPLNSQEMQEVICDAFLKRLLPDEQMEDLTEDNISG